MKLGQFSTLTFDCYGTLIDWETGIHRALQPLLQMTGKNFDKEDALAAFHQAEGPAQQNNPNLLYRDLLAAVHREIAAQLDISATEAMHHEFAQSIRDWPPFADSVESLRYLKQHYRLVILSNVDNAGFAFSNRHLEVDFDEIFTAEDIGSYKPSLANFTYMLEKLSAQGISKSEILHTAQSLYHDMVPATEIGLTRCWINRRAGQKGSGATPTVNQKVEVDWQFVSLAEMVTAHRAEVESS